MMSGPKHSTVAVVRRIVNRLQEISDATSSATSKKGLPPPSPPSLQPRQIKQHVTPGPAAIRNSLPSGPAQPRLKFTVRVAV